MAESLVEQFLGPIAPRSLLAVGSTPWPALQAYCEQHHIDYCFQSMDQRLPLDGRFDLSVAYGFETLPKQFVVEQLGILRNMLSDQVWALVTEPTHWSLIDFVALGFSRDRLPAQADIASYSYNLETYNNRRSWNNPQFWANPERWQLRF